jgi:hypothetical protein
MFECVDVFEMAEMVSKVLKKIRKDFSRRKKKRIEKKRRGSVD